MITKEGNYLITTDDWFYAPDGKKYKSVYGYCKIYSDSELGIKTNKNSTNWYIVVSGEDDEMIVAGCQIHYAVRTDWIDDGKIFDNHYGDSGLKEFVRVSEIYRVQ